jgi:hypothetical protein
MTGIKLYKAVRPVPGFLAAMKNMIHKYAKGIRIILENRRKL